MAFKFLKRGKSAPKACVFGVDGVPHKLLRRFMDEGVMPRAVEIFERGTLHRMKVTLPEVSSVSWTSFMTGAGPGVHGVYGFTDFKPRSYDIRFPSFPELKASTFWDRLGEKGKRSIVINQPSTYPARPIPGMLVSGFVAIDMKRAVHPITLYDKLIEMDYEIDVDSRKGGQDADFLFKQLRSTLEGRERAFDYFWEKEWDLFEIVVTGTDRLMHFQMDGAFDESHGNHQRFLDYYHDVDAFLGRAFDRYIEKTGDESGAGFFALSDHGFTEIKEEFYLNAWLENEGYLAYRSDNATGFEEIAPGALALALDPTRIYIHTADRFPRGGVRSDEVRPLCEELREKALAVEYQGEKVFQAGHLGADLYSGPEKHRGPDLVLVANDGYDVKGWHRSGDPFGRSHFTGMHNWDDAFLWSPDKMPEAFDITGIASVIENRLTKGDSNGG